VPEFQLPLPHRTAIVDSDIIVSAECVMNVHNYSPLLRSRSRRRNERHFAQPDSAAVSAAREYLLMSPNDDVLTR